MTATLAASCLDNRHLVPRRLWTLLVDRIIKEWKVSPPLADRVLDQAIGFLRLCAARPGETYSPSTLVDIGWHVFIIHTKAYAAFCEALAGRFIHHTPYNEDEVDISGADCGPCGPCHNNEKGLPVGVNQLSRTVAAMRELGIPVDEALWSTSGVQIGWARHEPAREPDSLL